MGHAAGDFADGIATFFKTGFELTGCALQKSRFFLIGSIDPARGALVNHRQVQAYGAEGV